MTTHTASQFRRDQSPEVSHFFSVDTIILSESRAPLGACDIAHGEKAIGFCGGHRGNLYGFEVLGL